LITDAEGIVKASAVLNRVGRPEVLTETAGDGSDPRRPTEASAE
jgi:hypothetical protein